MEMISKLLKKIAYKINSFADTLGKTELTEFQKEVKRWFKDDGDKTLRMQYELSENSLVVDLGGYEGQWTSDIYSMYNCKVLIFEPYLPFALNIENRFKKNSKIQLFRFGLGAKSEKVAFSVLDNASSIFQKGDKKDVIELVSVVEFIRSKNITDVDLIKINIEGGEYDLLECLLDAGLITIFKNIQVQFHEPMIENAEHRMNEIHKRLSLTHELTYHYKFVWDNWKLKK